jgi:hypothetical protein
MGRERLEAPAGGHSGTYYGLIGSYWIEESNRIAPAGDEPEYD